MRTEEEKWALIKKLVYDKIRHTFHSSSVQFLNKQQCDKVADFIVALSKNEPQLGENPNNQTKYDDENQTF
jgi:hypothetical protein